MAVTGTPAVFLDRDGTVVEDVPYNHDPAAVRLTDGAGPALRSLADAGYLLVLVSNQSGLARGYFTTRDLDNVERRLRELLLRHGVVLAACRYCPHHPAGSVAELAVACSCRKPQPGMLLDAASRLGIDLPRSWMVGDILDDVEAGMRAGCRTVLLDNGNETEWHRGSPLREPHAIVGDLPRAARLIVGAAPRHRLHAVPGAEQGAELAP